MNPAGNGKYPSNIAQVYLSVVTAVLSIALALMLLKTPMLLLNYFITTFIVTAVTFFFKLHLLVIGTREVSETDTQYSKRAPRWKAPILFVLLLIVCIFLPLFLAGFLNPYVWFIFMVSFTSGLSIAEILLYLHMQ